MTFHEFAGYLGGVITTIALTVYLIAILKGKVHSNRITWGVWTLVNTMFVFMYYQSNGVVPSIWVPLVYLVGTGVTFLALMYMGQKGEWTWVEKVCLPAVFVVFVLWLIFRSSESALTLTMIIDIIGAIPLVVTLYRDPTADNLPAWLIGFLSNAVNLLALRDWSYAEASYPIYLTVLTLTITVLLLRKPKTITTTTTVTT